MRGSVNIWLIATLLIVAVVVAIYGAGMYAGIRGAELNCQYEKIAAVQRAIEQTNQIAAENAEVDAAYVETVEVIKTVYKTIEVRTDEHLAEHPVADGCDIGADGLHLWNEANAKATAPGQ